MIEEEKPKKTPEQLKTENNMNRKVKVGNYFRLVVLDPGSKVEKFTQAY